MKNKSQTSKFLSLILLLVGGFAVALLSYSIIWSGEIKQIAKDQVESVNSNELFISTDEDANHDTYLMPFTEDIETELAKVDGVKTFYVNHGFSTGYEIYTKNVIQIKSNDEVLYEYTTNILGNDEYLNNPGLTVYPYFAEQELDKRCSQVTSSKDGIYIDAVVASELGIETLPDGSTIKMDIYVPVATTPTVVNGVRNGISYTKDAVHLVFEKLSIELPIAGILSDDYASFGTNYGWFFMPNDQFTKYMAEAEKMHQFTAEESKITPTSYRIFIEDTASRSDVINEIKAISDEIYVDDTYELYNELVGVGDDITSQFYKTSIPVFVVAAILMVAYGFYNKSKEDMKKSILVMGVGFVFVSFIFTTYFAFSGLPSYPIEAIFPTGFMIFKMFLVSFVLSAVAALLTQLPSLKNK